jgi:hypothetical protein
MLKKIYFSLDNYVPLCEKWGEVGIDVDLVLKVAGIG